MTGTHKNSSFVSTSKSQFIAASKYARKIKRKSPSLDKNGSKMKLKLKKSNKMNLDSSFISDKENRYHPSENNLYHYDTITSYSNSGKYPQSNATTIPIQQMIVNKRSSINSICDNISKNSTFRFSKKSNLK